MPNAIYLFIDDLTKHFQGGMTEAVKVNGHSCNCLVYADNLLLLSECWKSFCHSMDRLGYYSAKWRLGISSKKIKLMVFDKSSKETELTILGMQRQNIARSTPIWEQLRHPVTHKAVWGFLEEVS